MSLIFPFDYQEEPVGTFRQKLLIFTNYLIVTTSLLAGLVFSLHHTLPLTIQILSLTDGVTKPQLRIPKSQLSLQIVRGANLQVEMPETYFSFGSEESEMLATVTLDKSFERVFASVAIVVIIMLTLPWTVARAALLGLKCQIVPTNSKKRKVNMKRSEETSVTFALFCQLMGMIFLVLFLGFFFSLISSYLRRI